MDRRSRRVWSLNKKNGLCVYRRFGCLAEKEGGEKVGTDTQAHRHPSALFIFLPLPVRFPSGTIPISNLPSSFLVDLLFHISRVRISLFVSRFQSDIQSSILLFYAFLQSSPSVSCFSTNIIHLDTTPRTCRLNQHCFTLKTSVRDILIFAIFHIKQSLRQTTNKALYQSLSNVTIKHPGGRRCPRPWRI